MTKNTIISVPLKLIQSADAEENPLITKMEFVFADDKPNGNKQGIPKNSFASIINSGAFMPIKMEKGKIGGHVASEPLGTIKELIEQDNRIVGMAALWNKERPSDVALLKQSYAEGNPIDISFEVQYTEFELDDSGVEWFLDPIVRAATIVSNPAYAGRTPMLSVASEEQHVDLPDESFAFIEPGGEIKDGITHPRSLRHFPYKDNDSNISEKLLNESLAQIENLENFDSRAEVLAVLNAAVAELKDKETQNKMEEKVKELEAEAKSLREQLEELQGQVKTLTEERDSLKEYKENREKADSQAELLKSRLEVLAEAGFEFTNEQVASKKDFWLALDDNAFKSYVSEIKSVKEASASADAGPAVPPDVSGNTAATNGIEMLREYLKKEDKDE